MTGKVDIREGLYYFETESKMLGKGGFGEVFLGQMKQDDGKLINVAVKITQAPQGEKDKQMNVYFQQEMEIAKRMNHKNTVKTYEIGRLKNGNYYIVMELCSNGCLLSYLYKLRKSYLTEEECKPFISEILQGLAYIHEQGIYHRDLKDQNILLDKDNVVKIADFGLAKERIKSSIRNSMMHNGRVTIVGTFGFMPPEIFKGKLGKKSDIFSFGAMVYKIITAKNLISGVDSISLKQANENFRVSQVDFPSDTFSPLFKDFLKRSLDENVDMRLNASELLDHPWLKSVDKTNTRLSAIQLNRFAEQNIDFQLEQAEKTVLNTIESDISERVQKRSATLYRVFQELQYDYMNSLQSSPFEGEQLEAWKECTQKLKAISALLIHSISTCTIGKSKVNMLDFSEWHLDPFIKDLESEESLTAEFYQPYAALSTRDLIKALLTDIEAIQSNTQNVTQTEYIIYFRDLFRLFVDNCGEITFKVAIDIPAFRQSHSKLSETSIRSILDKVKQKTGKMAISEASINIAATRDMTDAVDVRIKFVPFIVLN